MCGIAGIIGELAEHEVKSALASMLDVQRHRGPDDEGVNVVQLGTATVGLGNRRLAILDVSPLGHQPMVNPDTGDVLAYNGEIYNFPELGRELERAGFSFRGRSDTEVLLRAYERWGLGCLDRLRGMFAFALWDARRRRLLLARDHLGIKPLYYASLPGRGFLCASEVRALIASGLVPFALDQRALAGYLAYGAVQEPLTILQGVLALLPGSWMEVDVSSRVLAQGKYWEIPRPDPERHRVPLKGLVEEGRTVLEQAVRRHLVSDVSLGVFLSSGLDSTAVVGLARQVASTEVRAFTVSFPDDPQVDEGPIAGETARRLGVAHHECAVDSGTALRWAEQGLERMDQPAMDGLNTYMVSRAVREQGIVVALSGQGGDEVFGGYRSFRGVPCWYRRMRWLRLLAPEWRAALVRLATARMDSVVREKAQDVARTGPDLPGLYFHYRRLCSDGDMGRLGLAPSALGLTGSFHDSVLEGHRCLVPQDPTAMVGRLETVFYLGNTLLRDGDVFGMANSLEIRVPFLDRDLVEWAFRLPGSVLLPKGTPDKYLLRQMCADFYDPVQTRQPKRGFTPPFHQWLLGPLREVMEECLGIVKRSGLLAPEGVDRIREVFRREPRSAAWSRVWGLVALGYWLNRHAASTASVRER